jgi:hypothetical protein
MEGLKGRHHFVDIDVCSWEIIFKWILKKLDLGMCTGSIWHRIETSNEKFEVSNFEVP